MKKTFLLTLLFWGLTLKAWPPPTSVYYGPLYSGNIIHPNSTKSTYNIKINIEAAGSGVILKRGLVISTFDNPDQILHKFFQTPEGKRIKEINPKKIPSLAFHKNKTRIHFFLGTLSHHGVENIESLELIWITPIKSYSESRQEAREALIKARQATKRARIEGVPIDLKPDARYLDARNEEFKRIFKPDTNRNFLPQIERWLNQNSLAAWANEEISHQLLDYAFTTDDHRLMDIYLRTGHPLSRFNFWLDTILTLQDEKLYYHLKTELPVDKLQNIVEVALRSSSANITAYLIKRGALQSLSPQNKESFKTTIMSFKESTAPKKITFSYSRFHNGKRPFTPDEKRRLFDFWEKNKTWLKKVYNGINKGQTGAGLLAKDDGPLFIPAAELDRRYKLMIKKACPCLTRCTPQNPIEKSWCYISEEYLLPSSCENIIDTLEHDAKPFEKTTLWGHGQLKFARKCTPGID